VNEAIDTELKRATDGYCFRIGTTVYGFVNEDCYDTLGTITELAAVLAHLRELPDHDRAEPIAVRLQVAVALA
jgi:hypothetical protein